MVDLPTDAKINDHLTHELVNAVAGSVNSISNLVPAVAADVLAAQSSLSGIQATTSVNQANLLAANATIATQAALMSNLQAAIAAAQDRLTVLENVPPPPPAAPGKPTGLTSGTITTTSVALVWAAPAGTPATSYQTRRAAPGSGAWVPGPLVTAPTVTATVTGLIQSTPYDFSVVPFNAAGPGVVSDIITRTTLAAPTGVTPSPAWTEMPPATSIVMDDLGVVTVLGGVIYLNAPPSVVTGGDFSVSAGKILRPDGVEFKAKGINVADQSISVATKARLLALFPGINFVRLAVGAGANGFASAQPTQVILDYVASLTASPNPIVVLLESHIQTGGTNASLTAHPLYTTLANALKTNTYAWFGSENEVVGEVSKGHLASYNAVRATGATNIFVCCTRGGNPANQGGTPFGSTGSIADYAGMTNACWDMHWYNWITNGDTNQTNVNNLLATDIAAWANVATSASGVMPVIIGEGGFINYLPGGDINVDVNGAFGTNEIVRSMLTTGKTVGAGGCIWLWNGGPFGWPTTTDLVNRSTNALTAHGQFAAALIADTMGLSNSVILVLKDDTGVIYQENVDLGWWYWDPTQTDPWVFTSDPRPVQPGSGIPAIAAAVGYNQLTFGPSPRTGWFVLDGTAVDQPDGSVRLISADGYNGGYVSALPTGGYMGFTGTAIGGGAYFRFTAKWSGVGLGVDGWPMLALNDMEGQTGFDQTGVSIHYPGRPTNSNLWFEAGVMLDQGSNSGDYGSTLWLYSTEFAPISAAPARKAFPGGFTDRTSYHTYGLLWVPATPTARGYMAYCYDDIPFQRVEWDYRADRNTLPAPPSFTDLGGNVFLANVGSDIDFRHWRMVMGSGTDSPIDVLKVEVWQGSSAANIIQ